MNALKPGDDLIDLHAFHEFGDAKEISRAATHHGEMLDDIAFIDDAHLLGADVARLVDEGLLHKGQLLDDLAKDVSGSTAKSVALIGVDVHGKGVLRRDADDDIAEDGIAA